MFKNTQHHHPFAVNTPLIDDYMVKNSSEFNEIVEENENVKLIITGHVHGNYTIKNNNIVQESGPATCFQWLKSSKDIAIERQTGFKIYTFTRDGYEAQTILYNF